MSCLVVLLAQLAAALYSSCSSDDSIDGTFTKKLLMFIVLTNTGAASGMDPLMVYLLTLSMTVSL